MALWKKQSEVAQSSLTLCDPMDCSLPGSSVRGIFQAILLEWIAISFSRRSSQPMDWTQVSCIVDRCFTVWATREAVMFNSSLAVFQDCFSYLRSFLVLYEFQNCFFYFHKKNAIGGLTEARGWRFPANHTAPCQAAAFGEPVSPFCPPFHCCCFHTPLEYSSWLVSAYLTKGTDLCVAFELMCWDALGREDSRALSSILVMSVLCSFE